MGGMMTCRAFWSLAIVMGYASTGLEAKSASLTNHDEEPFVMTVTEGGHKAEVTLLTGQTIEFCLEGCFVALPNGDRAALTGTELLSITSGRVKPN